MFEVSRTSTAIAESCRVFSLLATSVIELDDAVANERLIKFPEGASGKLQSHSNAISRMETPEETDDRMGVLPSTEIDIGSPDKSGPPMSEDQWSSIKGILEYVLGYREGESVLQSVTETVPALLTC